MEPQVENKETCVKTCKEAYVITQEDMPTMRKLTYQLGKLNESLKKFQEMAASGDLFSSFFQ